MLRYAARKGGLYPEDIEAAYRVDNIIAAVDDYRTEAYKAFRNDTICYILYSISDAALTYSQLDRCLQPIFSVLMGNPNADLIATHRNQVIPTHFKNFERLLGGFSLSSA